MCSVVLRCDRQCTSRRRRASHEFATRCAPAAWASTTSTEARICGRGRHERLPVGVVTDALCAILASFYGYTCKMVSTYMADKKQET
jgi:hypothetical protein